MKQMKRIILLLLLAAFSQWQERLPALLDCIREDLIQFEIFLVCTK